MTGRSSTSRRPDLMTIEPADAVTPGRDAEARHGAEAAPPERSHVSGWLLVLLRPIHWLILHVYFRVEYVHPERIPARGPALLVPTHRSRWDPIILAGATRRHLRFMASHDEFVGAQGWLMRRLGAFAVNTKRPTPGVLRHCRDLILAGEPLVIFAEGTIFYYPPHQVHPIKPGTAWLALECLEERHETPFPVIPVRMVYSQRRPGFRTRVEVIIQEPIALGPYLELPHREAIRRLTADLQLGLGDVVNDSRAEMSPPRAGSGSDSGSNPG